MRALAKDAGLDIDKALASFEERVGFMAARGLPIDDFAYSAAFVRDLDYYTGFVFEAVGPTSRRPPALGGGRYDGLARKLGAARRRRRSARRSGSTALGDAPMTLTIAVPSKGRLQENAYDYFARAGLDIAQGRGARDYRGAIAGLPGVEVAFLSASEIVGQLASGAAHLGVTGEDLVREHVADADSGWCC